MGAGVLLIVHIGVHDIPTVFENVLDHHVAYEKVTTHAIYCESCTISHNNNYLNMPNDMQDLLKWSINAAQNPAEAGNPNPELMAQLFGAPDDVTLMREELRAAVESKDQDERLECLDKFDEHIAKMDNANNMGALWEPLLFLVNDSDPEISASALTCVSTAVQNNDKAQADLVATKSGIPLILDKTNHNDNNVAAKALLALSSAIAHCEPAYDQFVSAKGWEVFAYVFSNTFETDDNRPEKTRGRVLSLLYSLVLLVPRQEVHGELEKLRIVPKLQALATKEAGTNKEKIENILSTLKENPKPEPKLLAVN